MSLRTDGLNLGSLSTTTKQVLVDVIMEQRPEVCVIGSLNADYSLTGVAHVSSERRFEVGGGSNVASNYQLGDLGGKGGNEALASAIMLATLGGGGALGGARRGHKSSSSNGLHDAASISRPITSFVGCVGDDAIGKQLVTLLEGKGVEMVHQTSAATQL